VAGGRAPCSRSCSSTEASVLRAAGRPEEANAAARDALRLYEAKGNAVSAEGVRALLAAPASSG
jgi:hypothetical protein